MSPEFSTKLCRVLTRDGLQLEGVLMEPLASAGGLPVSAFLLVHGTGSSFYAAGVLEQFALQAVQAGASVLRVNTRGNNLVTRIAGPARSVWGGAAYETISDCRKDLAAWTEFLTERGHERIAWAGHSMGAVKAIYAQANDRHAAVRFVVGISPPRFCHERFLSHPLAEPFREDFERAKAMVEQGQGGQLLSVRQPLPLLMTAEGFLAKYGPHDEYDYLRSVPLLRCPGLILIGSESARTSPAFAGAPEDVVKLIAEQPDLCLSFELIEGADTVYSTGQEVPFHHAERWLRSWA